MTDVTGILDSSGTLFMIAIMGKIRTGLGLILATLLGLTSAVQAQVPPDALPPEAPKYDASSSGFAVYALMALFAILILIATFKNAKRNDVTQVRSIR